MEKRLCTGETKKYYGKARLGIKINCYWINCYCTRTGQKKVSQLEYRPLYWGEWVKSTLSEKLEGVTMSKIAEFCKDPKLKKAQEFTASL